MPGRRLEEKEGPDGHAGVTVGGIVRTGEPCRGDGWNNSVACRQGGLVLPYPGVSSRGKARDSAPSYNYVMAWVCDR